MSKFSKVALALELLVFAVPVTGLFIFFGPLLLGVTLMGKMVWNPLAEVAALIAISLILFCFWKLVFLIYRGKRKEALTASPMLWVFMLLGISYSVIGAVVIWLIEPYPSVIEIPAIFALITFFRLGLFGIPMIIPAIHMLSWRISTDKSSSQHW